AFRAERQHDLAAQSSRRVRGIEDLLHHASGLAVGDRRLLAAHTPREVPHLLGEAVVPMLLGHGIRPAPGRGRLFDRVAEPHLRVRRERVAHEQVGVGLPLVAEYLDAVVDRKSTRLNSSHVSISYAVFFLKKKITLVDDLIVTIVNSTLANYATMPYPLPTFRAPKLTFHRIVSPCGPSIRLTVCISSHYPN